MTDIDIKNALEKAGDPVALKLLLQEDGSRHLQVERAPNPLAARGVRSHAFYDVHSFCDYLNREGKEKGATIFCDLAGRCEGHVKVVVAEAVLDDLSCSHYPREVVELRPRFHTLLEAWLAKESWGAKGFAELLRQTKPAWERTAPELRLFLRALRVARQFELLQDPKGLDQSLVVKGSVANERAEPIQVPDEITLEMPLFEHRDPVEFEVVLSYEITEHGGLVVKILPAALQHAVLVEGMTISKTIRERLPKYLCVYGSSEEHQVVRENLG